MTLFPLGDPWPEYIRRYQAYCLIKGKAPGQVRNVDYMLWLQGKLKQWKEENSQPRRGNGEYQALTPKQHELFDDWLMSHEKEELTQ